MSAILAAAGAFPTLFSTNAHIVVPHCTGVAISHNHPSPCIPVDPDRYPSWECKSLTYNGYYDSTSHESCIKENTGFSVVSYCMCRQGPRYTCAPVKISETEAWSRNVTVWFEVVPPSGNGHCTNCTDDHVKKIPCLFCGEVHD